MSTPMRVAHYRRQGVDPCRMAMLRQQAEYSVKPRELCCIATGSLSKRRAGKGAERRAHQSVSGSSDVPLSAARDRRRSVFLQLALADRGGDLLIRFGE
jgi:hypothetical protein